MEVKTQIPKDSGRAVAMIDFKGQIMLACEYAIYQLIEQDMVFKKLRFEEEPAAHKIPAVRPEKPKVYDFDLLWQQYPRKIGKDDALRHFKAQIRCDRDYADIQQALTNFLASKAAQGELQYIPHGSTWFNNRWKDFINYIEAEAAQFTAEDQTLKKLGLHNDNNNKR